MLLDLLTPQPWELDALCREPDYADLVWFPERGQDPRPAQAVCARCTVRAECLAFALDAEIEGGVWGGETAVGLRRLGRDRRRQVVSFTARAARG